MPSNGNNYGACDGYVIDHIKPLACGGIDAPDNMQWQTIEVGNRLFVVILNSKTG
jgi:hypothetical protein